MRSFMLPKRIILLLLLLLPLVVLACADAEGTSNPLLPVVYEIDPLFREFYDLLGGQDVLGPPISPIFPAGSAMYQYTVASLMVYDPQEAASQRFHLAALGLDMGVAEPVVARPNESNLRYVDGHTIYDLFVPLYDLLGGARYVGPPITEVHYNPEFGRYEQYFENLGMYWLENDPPDNVHLLAYGAWKCDSTCRQPPLGTNTVKLPYRIAEPFLEAVSRLAPTFTGFAISEAYSTPDGYTEQVFENVVLVTDPDQPSHVFLRSITESLGIQPDPLVPPLEDEKDLKFFPVRGGKGYNVPLRFMDYMANHGGIVAAGAPISELNRIEDNIYRQCFTNLCLEEWFKATGESVIKPAQLGYMYTMLQVQAVSKDDNEVTKPETPQEYSDGPQPQIIEGSLPEPTEASFMDEQSREVSLQVWEVYPTVAPNQSQEIGVSVFADGFPLPMVEPDIVLEFPDQSTKTYYMDPTSDNGQSRLQLDPIDLPNGTLVPYEVCIYNLTNRGKFCVRDAFLIWQNP